MAYVLERILPRVQDRVLEGLARAIGTDYYTDFRRGAFPSSGTFIRATDRTRMDSAGLLDVVGPGVPAFTHYWDGTARPLGLAMHEQRTGLLLWSEALDNAAWTPIRATVPPNRAPAPDGNLAADGLVEDTSVGTHYLSQQQTVPVAPVTLSVWAKPDPANPRNVIRVYMENPAAATNFAFAEFDVAAGTIFTPATTGGAYANASAEIVPWANGWYLCGVTATPDVTTVSSIFWLNNGSGISYTGDGVSGIDLWGAGLISSELLLPYVPTAGAQVTHNLDQATDLYDWNGGTITADLRFQQVSSVSQSILTIDDTTGNNRVRIYKDGTSGRISLFINTGNVSQVFDTTNGPVVTEGTDYKIAVRAVDGDVALFVNGVKYITGGGTMPATSRMVFGDDWDFGSVLNNPLAKVTGYPVGLTDQELADITS